MQIECTADLAGKFLSLIASQLTCTEQLQKFSLMHVQDCDWLVFVAVASLNCNDCCPNNMSKKFASKTVK